MSRNIAGDLESLLIEWRLLSTEQLAMAKREAQRQSRRLAPTIIDLGMVSDRRFAEWMSQMTGIPIIDPIPTAAVELLVRRLPRAIAREFEVVPLKIEPGTLTIATVNPLDSGCLEVLRATTAMDIHPLIALHGSLMDALATFYPEDKIEPTLMPAAFDPGETMAVRKADDSPGSTTQMVLPPQPDSQLDRIERAINELQKMVTGLQERIAEIDETLEHLLSRR